MTLATADELKTEIASDLARSNVDSGSAILDRFIIQAERYMNSRLRVKETEKSTTLTIDAEFIDLPSDFIELKHIEFDDSPQLVEPVSERLISTTGQGTTTGTSRDFSLVFDNTTKLHQLRFGPTPDGSRSASLRYYAELLTLTGNATNALFLKDPELYLTGCLYFGFRKFRNADAAVGYKGLFDENIAELNSENNKKTAMPGTRVRAVRRL